MSLLRRKLRVSLALMLVTSAVFSQTTYREIDVKSGAIIRGIVRFSGKIPTPEVIPVNRDTATCGKNKQISSLAIGKTNGVKDSFVFLEGVSTGKKWPAISTTTLNQENCEYEPHVLVVRAGEKMEIANGDSLLHNVHAYSLDSVDPNQPGPPTLFNIALPIKGLRIPRTMTKPGTVMTLCDAGHPWMNAYVLVADNPYYAVTDDNGSFVLDAVPAVTYTVKMWHEGIGKFEKATKAFIPGKPFNQEKKVTVESGRTITIDFNLTS